MLVESVVSGKSVDSALHKNQPELSILVLSVSLQVLSDIHCLLDQMVQVLRNLRSKSVFLQDSENLIAGDTLNLGDAIVVSENDADLRGRGALLGQFDNLFDKFIS